MVLVDSSVWINHFRTANRNLKTLLLDGDVLCHPFVIGELACGNLKNRGDILGLLRLLPQAPLAEFEELLDFIGKHKLTGMGIGWIDVHLLASSLLASGRLWTEDKRLKQAAEKLRVAF